MEQQTRKEIQIKLESSPLILQHLADHIIQIQREKNKDKASRGRLDDESKDPPHLSSQDRSCIQCQKAGIQIRRYHLHHKSQCVQYNNIIH